MVVAIILIIATMAIPALIRSRQAASESAAVATLRVIGNAQATYSASHSGNFSGTLAALVSEGFIDNRFDSDPAQVDGFTFSLTQPGGRTDYRLDADPQSSVAARYNYYTLPDGVIRYDDDADNPFPQGMPVQ